MNISREKRGKKSMLDTKIFLLSNCVSTYLNTILIHWVRCILRSVNTLIKDNSKFTYFDEKREVLGF